MQPHCPSLVVATAAPSVLAITASRALVNGEQNPGGVVEGITAGDVFGFSANASPYSAILSGRAAFQGVDKTGAMAMAILLRSESAGTTQSSTRRHILVNTGPIGNAHAATLAKAFAMTGSVR